MWVLLPNHNNTLLLDERPDAFDSIIRCRPELRFILVVGSGPAILVIAEDRPRTNACATNDVAGSVDCEMFYKYSLKAPMQVVSSMHHDIVSIDAQASSKIMTRLTKEP